MTVCERPAERDRIIVVVLAHRARVRQQHPSVIGRSGNAGLRKRPAKPARDIAGRGRACPASTSFITPIATTILLIEATRTGSSARDFAAPICGSATPSAKLAISPLRSKATPTSAWTGRPCGTVAQAARARPATTASTHARTYADGTSSATGAAVAVANRGTPAMTSRGDRGAAQRESGDDRNCCRGPDGNPARRQDDEERGGEGRGRDVQLTPHEDRRLAGENVADDPAGAGRQHAHAKAGTGATP